MDMLWMLWLEQGLAKAVLAHCWEATADKNLGVFTGFLAGIAWKGTETFKQARPLALLCVAAA